MLSFLRVGRNRRRCFQRLDASLNLTDFSLQKLDHEGRAAQGPIPSRSTFVSTRVTGAQGRDVVPSTLSREGEALRIESTRSRFDQLMAECARKDKSLWTRVKKSARVNVWEKRSVKGHVAKKKKRGLSIPSRMATIELASASDALTYCVRSSTTVHAPLDTVLKVLDTSTASAYRSFTRIIYGNLVADTSVLFHSSTDFQTEGENRTYETLSVRWLRCRGSSHPMVSDCDFCLQEYTKRHSTDELSMLGNQFSNNKPRPESRSFDGLHAVEDVPMAYKLFNSIESKHCPELPESHRVVRCHVPLGGFLLYPTPSKEKTDAVFYMSVVQHVCGDRSDSSKPERGNQCSDRQFRAIQSVARQMATQLDRLENAVESYTMILYLESLRTLQWVRNAERIQCVICCRRFHQLTRRRHHCRLCGEVICRGCSVHKNVDLPTFGPAMLRICTRCNDLHLSRSKAASRSELKGLVACEKPRRRLTADQSTDKFKLELVPTSFRENPFRQRSKTMAGESVQNALSGEQSIA